jgi:hypothetical protein
MHHQEYMVERYVKEGVEGEERIQRGWRRRGRF